MNAIAGKIAPTLSLDEVHIWRSRLVEKCAEAERHVLLRLERAGYTCASKAPLSQKIEALKKALNDPATTPDPPDGLLKLLDDLRPYSDLRSDLVHSTASIALVEGETVAVFRSASEQKEGSGKRYIATLVFLKAAHGRVSAIANGLKQAAGRA